MTCPVVAWCYLPHPQRAPSEPTGYRRVDRRTCPECGQPGKPIRHPDGTKSSTLAEHKETP